MTPTKCEHPDCDKEAIAGVNNRYVCKDHLDWVFKKFVLSPAKILEKLNGPRRP